MTLKLPHLAAAISAAALALAASAAPPPANAPTNRIAITDSVRKNLGMTFATVERRAVGQTMRVPGRFELLPTATRQYRSPLKGQVEILVNQYQRVDTGTPLYRVESSAWGELLEQIASTQAKVQSMGPLREAHKVHERSLADKVQIWKERLAQLEELRAAGGGSASQFAEARAALNGTQAELAEIMEKDAELQAQQKALEADLRSLQNRRDLLLKAVGGASGAGGTATDSAPTRALEVRAIGPGVVESLNTVSGGLIDDGGLVLTVTQPELIRFRAKALQSDLGKLKDGLRARIMPPAGSSIPQQDALIGDLTIGLSADPDERTIDLVVQPTSKASWARAGVSAQLEIALGGGTEELAIPIAAVVKDGAVPIIFRRDPADPDKAIRMEADLGVSDGRWVVVASGVKEGDQVVVDGNRQLMLAMSGSAPRGGHFHSDGTFHEGKD